MKLTLIAVASTLVALSFSVLAEELKGLTTGDRVSFSFRLEGGKASIVSIRK